ncbi:15534_t:CDS:2 [Entrophospora sp. SA101]|nr:15433_t:CDS:2 [Entrophospora sp. SA101]CAJ0847130.1 15534_t:CDS:2 [Entrophospora sp. SA101]
MSDPQNKLTGGPPQMCGFILLKNKKKNLKDITLHNAKCLRQINDDNNNENLESSITQQPISNFYESTLLTKKRNDSI